MRMILKSLALALCLIPAGCGDDDNKGGGEPAAPLSVSQTELTFGSEGGDAAVTLTAPGEWDAVTDADWVTLTKTGQLERDGRVDITVTENTSREARSASVTVMSGTSRAYITVSQTGRKVIEADPSVNVPHGYELVWADEFDGNSLNRQDWTHEVQGPGWVNNELQTYVDGTADGRPVTEVSDGTLKIHCFKGDDGRIFSGRIYARVNTGWKYGIVEARIRLPRGRGTWPAFWMMPVNNNFSTNPWPRCGEIDIMEEVGYNPDYTSSSIHCDSYNHAHGTQKTAERYTAGAQDDFHDYRLEWTESAITTYVDGRALLVFPNDGLGNVATWPFNKPFYVILNLAWGGSWGGAHGVDESCLPATMEVEYVRVFQKTN